MDPSGPSPKKMKRAELDGSDDEGNEDTQMYLEQVDVCQNEIEKFNEEAAVEIIEIEAKYNKLRKPIYDKRSLSIENIPNFWMTAMLRHPQLSTLVSEDEEDCLQFLKKLDVEEYDDIKSGFKLSFFFDENPYFENDLLVKEFNFVALLDGLTSTSTEIRWKPGMNFAKLLKDRSIPKPGKRILEQKSFFSWFSNNPPGDVSDDDIAEIIKDDLWLNPLQYFLGTDDSDYELEEGENEEAEEDIEMSTEEEDEEGEVEGTQLPSVGAEDEDEDEV